VCNSGGKIKRTRAAAAATRSLATAAAFGDIILYGGAGNFPNVEHLFVRSFMTRAARGGYWRGPVDRRRLVAVVVRVAVVALPLSGRARTHSHTHTRASTRPHRYGTTYTGARRTIAHTRSDGGGRGGRLVEWVGYGARVGGVAPGPAAGGLSPPRRRPIDERAGLVCTAADSALSRHTSDRVFTYYYFTLRRVHASL